MRNLQHRITNTTQTLPDTVLPPVRSAPAALSQLWRELCLLECLESLESLESLDPFAICLIEKICCSYSESLRDDYILTLQSPRLVQSPTAEKNTCSQNLPSG